MLLPLSLIDNTVSDLFSQRIADLYSRIDSAFSDAANSYVFSCKGCERNCCEERFYHYTLAEHISLKNGVASLGQEAREEIFRRAEEVMRLYRLHDASRHPERLLCPLNLDGFCLLYAYRPMICRLQGVPHYVNKTGHLPQRGPGCRVFNENNRSENLSDSGFDHTPFYAEMAAIEIEIRKMLNNRGRYKKTVAEMLLDIRNSEDSVEQRSS